jgi:long-chain acyl-CoA synthetase
MPQRWPNVSELLLDGRDPFKVALWTLNRQYTYADISAAVLAVTRYLRTLPLRKGDRLLLASENSFFWVAAYFGSLRAGLVCVPAAASISRPDLDCILESVEAKIAFVESRFAVRNSTCLAGCHIVADREGGAIAGAASQVAFDRILALPNSGPDAAPEGSGDDPAALMFTSGSTGRPRGVVITHRNIAANTDSIIQYLSLTAADRIMTVLPFHYCFGTSLLHTHLRVGGTLVIDPRFMYPEVVLQRMIETECTGFAGVPSHFQILLRRSGLRAKRFPHLRYVQQAGGHLAPTFVRELREALPETQIFTMYGQTEATARLSYLPPAMLDAKAGSIGKGIPGVTLSVIDESGREVHPGEVGEIVAEGDNIAAGYWRAPEESAACFRNGRLYTGDQATVDEDGYLRIVGRSKDFLKCGGKRVSCRWLEDLVLEFEDVLEAAAIGTPDEVLGEAVHLFVVARDPATEDLDAPLLAHCRSRMPAECVPKSITLLRSLPKNSSGKVLKEVLKRQTAATHETVQPGRVRTRESATQWAL